VLLERGAELGAASLPFSAAARPRPAPGDRRRRSRSPPALHPQAAAERRCIEEALDRAGGVRREAARLLGIDERNIPYFLRKHGLS
jgi:transcriptional regulator with GAF, ATPase, and Fis domain